jgi:peptidoglycan/xylan/chitin deacetylase (PgdA/CDA1 family)
MGNIKYRVFWYLGTFICAFFYFFGIYWLYKNWRLKRKHFILIVLTYHRIRDDHKESDITVPVDLLDRQLSFLKTHYQVVSLDHLLHYRDGLKELNSDAVSITFDDGYQDNYLKAFPLLKKHHAPATIFLVYQYINKNDEYLTFEQIKEMGNHNIVFGSHTLSHPILSEVDEKRAHHEIYDSKTELESTLKCKIHYFAYPKGKAKHINENNIASVKQAGYQAAFMTENGLIDQAGDRYRLKRLGIRECPLFVFKVRTSGIFETGSILFLRKIIGMI